VALAVEGEAEEVAVEVVVDSNILMGVDQAIIKGAVVVMVVAVVEGEEEDQTSTIHQRFLTESNHYTVSAFITQEMAAAAMATHAGKDLVIDLMNVLSWSINFLENGYLTKSDIVLMNLGNCIWLQ
jgi:hypothetical protein